MKPVAIVGAGITGLTAAFYLKRAGIPVTVFETGNRVGGAIRSVRKDGYLAECGPNTILETSPGITRLLRDTNLGSRRVNPEPSAKTRYLVRAGRPIPMPSSPFGFLTTKLFSSQAKLALMREPFVRRRRDDSEESVAEFVIRRLGREFLDRAIDPLVGGIYAGDPAKLSLRHAFPRLAALESKYGSLIGGMVLGASDRRKRGDVSKDRASAFSFDEGLQVLPETLHSLLGDAVRFETSVTGLSRIGQGWRLHLCEKTGDTFSEHGAVIYAGSAFRLAEFQITGNDDRKIDLSPLTEIRHPPVSSVVLGYRREDVTHPCNGFGALIPKVENFKILGTIFSSSLFANRAPEAHLSFTSYLGGERDPSVASLPSDALFELTHHDLRTLFGIKGNPIFCHHAFYPRAIPQYNLGHDRFKSLMNEVERKASRFYFAGNYRDGISLADSILSGSNIAERVEKELKSAQPCDS